MEPTMALSFWKRWYRSSLDSSLARREPGLRPCLEPLEDRVLLDAGLPPALVVGRTLSSYFVGGIQNNQETIAYTVYNQTPDAVSGVLLTDALQPGVTFQGASQLPDQSGQDLAWSLGTIQGHDRASVTLTVELANPIPLQLDTGAQAFGMLNAGAVSNATPAAVLRPGSVDPSLLASTPDANTTDPFVQEKAAELHYDPQQIFNFLQTEIGYNSYSGSLRGARGTLWSSAGNALDETSLGVALLRASGVPAQYAEGTLATNQAQQLILSMFPASYQTVGYVPAGTQTADPANDPQLLAETEDHFWLQFDPGSGMQDADPEFAAAQIGQTFTTATNGFTEVPDYLRHTVEVQLNAEIYSQAGAAFGSPAFQTTTVLDQTFNTVDLVGHPLSIGNFVKTTSLGGLAFTTTTNTYAPYIQVGDEADPDPSHDEIIRGQDYQEVLTNFPLGSQILTGLFLDININGPDYAESYERALVDRIGFANRQNGTLNVTVNATAPPALSDFDIFTLNALPGLHDTAPPVQLLAATRSESQLLSQMVNPDGTVSATATPLLRQLVTNLTRLDSINFLQFSDLSTSRLASVAMVESYFDRPRLVIASSQVKSSGTAISEVLGIDLRRDTARVLAAPGQSSIAAWAFNLARGIAETLSERDTVGHFVPAAQQAAINNTENVFEAARAQGINLVLLTPNDLARLDSLVQASADAKARIAHALMDGKLVLVPQQLVQLGKVRTTAWYETDTSTGDTIGVTEDGGHEAEEETSLYIAILPAVYGLAGFIDGVIIGAVAEAVAVTQLSKPQLQSWKAVLNQDVTKDLATISAVVLALGGAAGGAFGAAFVTGFVDGAKLVNTLLNVDPPIGDVLYNPAIDHASANLATASQQVTANRAAGPVNGDGKVPSITLSNNLAATWSSTTTSSFQVQGLDAASAVVTDANNNVVGSGTVALNSAPLLPVAISGNVAYNVNGVGSLAFYGPAENNLGVSGNWQNYSASVSGNVSLQVFASTLTLNDIPLPAGRYTITTSSATLTGSGPSTSPNFSGSVSISATDSTINLGAGSGNMTVGGNPVDLSNGMTLTGYTGSVTVAAGGGINNDSVTFNGNTANVLSVSASPATLTTDPNTPITFQANVQTSFADAYNLTAQAPAGWTVSIDNNGNVTATPAPGLQGGTYPIQLVAQSTTNPDLVAQATVYVTLTPTQPGITFAINPDPLFTVPFNGAQVPTAFQAVIHNNGPAADTFNLSFSNLPPGFTLLNSGTTVTIPAGQTGLLGIYLQPSGQLPAPGTPISFTVTATSASNPAITATQTESFLMPEVHGVTLVSDPAAVNTTPGTPVTATLTLQDVGNVPENVTLAATTSTGGLTASSLNPVSLAVGQSTTETITLTPDAATPLNSFLVATVTATFGPSAAPQTQTLQVPVNVVIPGATALANAAVAANQLGNAGLVNRLSDLSIALTNLVQDPTNAVYQSQVQANLTSLISQFDNDPFLSPYAGSLTTAGAAIASATTAGEVEAAVINVGAALGSLTQTIIDEAQHGFTLSLDNSVPVAQPGGSNVVTLIMQNTGRATTTYDFSVSGLPAGVTATFSQPSITLAPGQNIPNGPSTVTLSLSQPVDALRGGPFTVTATAEVASEITRSTAGQLILRSESLLVGAVSTSPPFTGPGGQVDVTAKIQSVVNEPRQVAVSYTVTDPGGNLVFTSTPVTVPLTITSGLTTVDLGTFTAGPTRGLDTITVTVTDQSSQPLPSATGQAHLTVGLPVSANLSVSPTNLPTTNGFSELFGDPLLAGSGTITNTLPITATISLPDPLTLDGQVQTTPTATAVALYQDATHNLAYVAGTNGIDIVDVSTPASPTDDGTFGTSDIVKGGFTVGRVDNIGGTNYLLVGTTATLNASQFTLLVYSLANPLSPARVSSTVINYQVMADMLVQGNTVLVPTAGYPFFGGLIFDQFGSLLSIDVSNPAAPRLADVLYNNRGAPDGGDTNQNGGVIVNNHLAYIASTTSTGGGTEFFLGPLAGEGT
jgi:hypothetical protein